MSTQPGTSTPGRIYERAAQFQRELALPQSAAEDQVLASWRLAYTRIAAEYQQVLDKIGEAQAAGSPVSQAWLFQQERLRAAEATARAEMTRYAREATNATQEAMGAAGRASQRHAGALVEDATSALNLTASFVDLNTANLRHLTGLLADGSPVSELFAGLGDEVALSLREALVQGVALGHNPNKMAQRVVTALDMPRHRAVTIMRTESQRVYREVARETYQQNADVLGGWVWTAALSPRTCVACIAMHGTVHPLTETLDGHPRCRCAMVPRTKSWADLGVGDEVGDSRPPIPDGKAWLEGQSAKVQQAIMGRAKWARWKAGDLSMDDMVARTHSGDWGSMRRERSLVEIDAGKHPNTLPGIPTPTAARPPAGLPMDGTAEWERWHEGRDVRVAKPRAEVQAAIRADLDRAQRRVTDDTEQVAQAKARLKAEQDRLKSYVPDAKERAKYARKDTGILRAKDALKASEGYLDESTANLERARADMDRLGVTNLPDFDPENPLKAYGDRLVISDRTKVSARHLADAETHIPLHHHEVIRNHYAEQDGAGLYIGDEMLTDLDDLQRLNAQSPRGHGEGATWANVGGVYSPTNRVTAVARKAWRQDDADGLHATCVHELGHTLDAAVADRAQGSLPSGSPEWAEAMGAIHDAGLTRPYYDRAGNPTGWRSESWAEAYAGWAMRRGASKAERRSAILRTLGLRERTPEAMQAADGVLAYFDRLDAGLARGIG